VDFLCVFLWRKHEWEKHGTCAMMLPSLNSELKYFSAGLSLSAEFNFLKYVPRCHFVHFKIGVAVTEIDSHLCFYWPSYCVEVCNLCSVVKEEDIQLPLFWDL